MFVHLHVSSVLCEFSSVPRNKLTVCITRKKHFVFFHECQMNKSFMTFHFFCFCMLFTCFSNISIYIISLTSTLSATSLFSPDNQGMLLQPSQSRWPITNCFESCLLSVLNNCVVLLFPFREAVKVNGQMDCHPSAQGATLSPGRHSNVKKVTGVGGTTYEISVWAGTPDPPPMTLPQRVSSPSVFFCEV